MSSSWKNVLGWVPGDSLENTKRKYRSLALKMHPNKNPGKNTTADFQTIQAAWDDAGRFYNPTQTFTSSLYDDSKEYEPARSHTYYEMDQEKIKKAREELKQAWRKMAENEKKQRNSWGMGSDGKVSKNVRFQFKKIERSTVLRGKPSSTGDNMYVPGADIIDAARRLFRDELGGSIPDCYAKRMGVELGHVSSSKRDVSIHGPKVKYEEVIVVRKKRAGGY